MRPGHRPGAGRAFLMPAGLSCLNRASGRSRDSDHRRLFRWRPFLNPPVLRCRRPPIRSAPPHGDNPRPRAPAYIAGFPAPPLSPGGSPRPAVGGQRGPVGDGAGVPARPRIVLPGTEGVTAMGGPARASRRARFRRRAGSRAPRGGPPGHPRDDAV